MDPLRSNDQHNASGSSSSGDGSEVVVWIYPTKEKKNTFLSAVPANCFIDDKSLEHPIFGYCLYWRFE